MVRGFTSFIATALAPTIAPSPIVTPGPTNASAQIHASEQQQQQPRTPFFTETLPPGVPQNHSNVFSHHATHSDDQASRPDGAASLTQPTSYHLHWPEISGSSSCPLRQFSKPPRGPHLGKANQKVCNITGQSTSSVMSRPRLKVRVVPTMNNIRRRSDPLCSHQRMSDRSKAPSVCRLRPATPASSRKLSE
jgi:hypothetical protein